MKNPFKLSNSDYELEERVRRDMAFLFDEYSASIVSNQYEGSAFRSSILEIAVRHLRLRIVNDQCEHEVRVEIRSPIHGAWEPLDITLADCLGASRDKFSFLAKYDDDPTSLTYVGLTDVGRVLKANLDQVLAQRNGGRG